MMAHQGLDICLAYLFCVGLLAACSGRASNAAQTDGEGGAQTARSAEIICDPGETQRCVGPGACEGAQRCAEDGTIWEECDCGPPVAGRGGSAGETAQTPNDGKQAPDSEPGGAGEQSSGGTVPATSTGGQGGAAPTAPGGAGGQPTAQGCP